ncbi:hypothetical protein K7X08_012657 [Anisodus acutangulus]|uniref:Uncharacterized protein n=1 Tax=Anisodus acutangulus TaxID=402998 RepID=A0A9Q1M9I4_9SOLA|nr:hypothetical protein K7X08_012657 [Anisodus acutangulus]
MDYLKGKGQNCADTSAPNNTGFVQGDEIPKLQIEEEEEEGSEASVNENDDEIEEKGNVEVDATEEADMNLKRKRYSTTSVRTGAKKAKGRSMTYYNPIHELKLKEELRVDYEDPVEIDEVLEELNGEVSPKGTRRLRRRCNAEGVMEYWLEDAYLVDIRNEAGVNDPYWVPPSGWKPGDCPNQHISMLKKLSREVIQEKFSSLLSEIKKKVPEEKEDEKTTTTIIMHVKLLSVLDSNAVTETMLKCC